MASYGLEVEYEEKTGANDNYKSFALGTLKTLIAIYKEESRRNKSVFGNQ